MSEGYSFGNADPVPSDLLFEADGVGIGQTKNGKENKHAYPNRFLREECQSLNEAWNLEPIRGILMHIPVVVSLEVLKCSIEYEFAPLVEEQIVAIVSHEDYGLFLENSLNMPTQIFTDSRI